MILCFHVDFSFLITAQGRDDLQCNYFVKISDLMQREKVWIVVQYFLSLLKTCISLHVNILTKKEMAAIRKKLL